MVEPFARPIAFKDGLMGIAEFIIGPAVGRTRWLRPSYALRGDLRGLEEGTYGTTKSTRPE